MRARTAAPDHPAADFASWAEWLLRHAEKLCQREAGSDSPAEIRAATSGMHLLSPPTAPLLRQVVLEVGNREGTGRDECEGLCDTVGR